MAKVRAVEPTAAERLKISKNCDVCGHGEGLERKVTQEITVVICVDPTPCLTRARAAGVSW